MKLAAAAVSAGIVAGAAIAGPRYEPANIFGTGYADEQVSPGVWKVRGASATPDGGHEIAIYRAAELAQAAGVSELRIVQQKIVVTSRVDRANVPIMFMREIAHIKVRAIRQEADRTACEEKHAERCITVSVAKMMAQFGPELGQSAGPHPELALASPSMRMTAPLPPALLRAIAQRAFPATPLSHMVAYSPPAGSSGVSAPPSNAYEAGRQAGAAARAAQQADD